MEAFFVLVGLVFLIAPILGIAAFLKVRKVERELKGVRNELALLKAAPKVPPVAAMPQAAQSEETVSSAPTEETLEAAKPVDTSAKPGDGAAGPAEAATDSADETPEQLIPATVEGAGPWGTKVPPPPEPVSVPTPKKRGFIDELGARWSVWVGGIALALGAIFLLKYSIEAGFFGPGMRVTFAVLLGFAALGAGEWLYRTEQHEKNEALQNAYIPGVLTAVGIVALFGATYVSYELYKFIGPAPAFGLLGLISLTGLALGLRQGPAVSGLGLAASLVTPLLVTSTEPSYPTLYGYLAIVAAGALVLAAYRGWAWLSFAAAGGAFIWGMAGLGLHGAGPFATWLTYVITIFAMVVALHVVRVLKPITNSDQIQNTIFPIASYAATCFLMLGLLGADDTALRSMWASLAVCVVGVALAWQWRRLSLLAPIAGALSVFALLGRAADLAGGIAHWPPSGFHIPTPIEGSWGLLVLVAVSFALGLVVVCCLAARRREEGGHAPLIWAGAGTVFPFLIVFGLWGLGARGEIQIAFALIFVLFVLAFAAAAEWLIRALPEPENEGDAARPLITEWHVNLFAVFAPMAALLALAASLPGMLMTFGLVAVLVATAYAHTLRPVWLLRLACVGIGAILTLQGLDAIANGGGVGARIIFNELWAYLALPAAACAGVSWLLSQKHIDKWSQAMEALALALLALFAVFQVRHFMNDGDIFVDTIGLEELSLHIMVALSFSLGLSRIQSIGRFSLFSIAAMAAMGISLLNIVLGSLLALNPLFNPDQNVDGGFLFNSLLLAYLVPGLFLGAIAWLQQDNRPAWYLKTLGGVGLLLLIFYLTTMVRFGYQGGMEMALGNYDIANAEQYTYSIVWLVFGIALLAAGLVFKNRELRIGSAAVMMLTVAKVFLVDMSELEGILRALSFVGLGGVLIGMGLVYQRVLSQDEGEPEMEQTQDAT